MVSINNGLRSPASNPLTCPNKQIKPSENVPDFDLLQHFLSVTALCLIPARSLPPDALLCALNSVLTAFSFFFLPPVPPQDGEKLSPGRGAEWSPLSCCRYGAGSSRFHLGVVAETQPLRGSEPLPQKLLARLAEGGGEDLRSVSPYLLRLSGAGFVCYAPGPETSV